MKTESRYIYEKSDEAQGLGWMPSQLRPILDEPNPHNRRQEIRPRILPRPIPKPKPAGILRPIIDKNPVPAPPKLIIDALEKTTQKPHATSKSKTTNKSTSKQQSTSNENILSGTFSIGGMQVKKTHAAMAGGGIAGSLLLWKILF